MKVCTKLVLGIIAVVLVMSASAFGEQFSKPGKPDVEKKLDSDKEKKINEIAGLPAADVFMNLTGDDDFILDRDMLYKAIYKAFDNRKKEAMDYARSRLNLPLTYATDGAVITNIREFNLAKRMLEVFPDDAAPMLVSLYKVSSNVTIGNIIRAAGQIAGRQEIDDLLVQALGNTSEYEEENPDLTGYPMRICDLAYNQIVLRYSIRNVLRTISPAHRIEVRNEHINILKSLLQG